MEYTAELISGLANKALEVALAKSDEHKGNFLEVRIDEDGSSVDVVFSHGYGCDTNETWFNVTVEELNKPIEDISWEYQKEKLAKEEADKEAKRIKENAAAQRKKEADRLLYEQLKRQFAD